MFLEPDKLKNLQTQAYFWPKKLGWEQGRWMEIICTLCLQPSKILDIEMH